MLKTSGLELLTIKSDLNKLRGKKIAIVANCTWNIYKFRINIINALLEEGAEVLIIAAIDEFAPQLRISDNIKIIPLTKLNRCSKNPIKDIQLFYELVKIYKDYKPDVILHYTIKPNIYGSIAAGLLKIPNTCVVTGLGFSFIHNGILNLLVERLYKYSFNYSDTIHFENLDDKALFINKGLVKASKTKHIKGCGVDLIYYVSSEFNDNPLPFKFTFIGRLLYDKGIVEFVNAAKIVKAKYPNAGFTVVGFFDNENPSCLKHQELDEWIKSGIIEYHHFQEDIRPFIERSKCLVLPSYREGLPKIIMEAMAMGKPIIATNTAGCNELVIDGFNGYLVAPKDEIDLSKAMLRMLKCDSRVLKEMGRNSRIKAEEELDDKKIASKLISCLAELV